MVLLVLAALLPLAAADDVDVDREFNDTSIDPGQEKKIGVFTLQAVNDSVELTDVVTNRIPFNISYSKTSAVINDSVNVSVNASVPDNFQPQTYNGESIFIFSQHDEVEAGLEVTVNRVSHWNITDSSFKGNVSLGDNGELGTVRVENDGNVPATLDVAVTGNISEYLLFDSTVITQEGINEYPVNYRVEENAVPGLYTGNLTFSGGNRTEKVGARTRFLDTVDPVFARKKFKSFEATKPSTFKVLATDNVEVALVKAEVLYEVTVSDGNKTKSVNKTLETINFEKKEDDGNIWVGKSQKASRIDSYFVHGLIRDTAGNEVNFTDSFEVTPLESLVPKESVEFPGSKFDNTVSREIGRIERDTPVTVRLTSFNQPLGQGGGDWRVGLMTPSGKKFFNNVNDTIKLEQAQSLELRVYSDSPARYQGEIGYEVIEEHVDVPATTFYGRFANFTSPKDKKFVMLGKLYICDGQVSKILSQSKWMCQFNISAGRVPPGSSLKEEVQFMIPREAKDDFEQRYQTRIAKAERKAQKNGDIAAVSLFLGFISVFGSVYYTRYTGVHMGVYLAPRSHRKQAKNAVGKTLKNRFVNWYKNR